MTSKDLGSTDVEPWPILVFWLQRLGIVVHIKACLFNFRQVSRLFHSSGNFNIKILIRNGILAISKYSYADICKHIPCQAKPHNRNCFDLRGNTTSMMTLRRRNPVLEQMNCCPKWFCEEGIDAENPSCNFKILEPTCNNPPKDKKNCVAFIDQNGCCPKFQCEGGGFIHSMLALRLFSNLCFSSS